MRRVTQVTVNLAAELTKVRSLRVGIETWIDRYISMTARDVTNSMLLLSWNNRGHCDRMFFAAKNNSGHQTYEAEGHPNHSPDNISFLMSVCQDGGSCK